MIMLVKLETVNQWPIGRIDVIRTSQSNGDGWLMGYFPLDYFIYSC